VAGSAVAGQGRRSRRQAGVVATEHTHRAACHHHIEPEQLTAHQVERRLRHAAGALRHDVGDTRPLDQALDIDAVHDGIDVDTREQSVGVGPVEEMVDVEALDDLIGTDDSSMRSRFPRGDPNVRRRHRHRAGPRQVRRAPTTVRQYVRPSARPALITSATRRGLMSRRTSRVR